METPLRERQRQQRVEDILDAAHALALEVGYEELTMDALAARAGMTKPTLYAHFENKEAIAVAAIVRNIRRGQASLRELSPALSPIAKLETYFRWALRSKFIERRLAFGGVTVSVIRTNPEYKKAFQEMIDTLSAIVEAGKASGEINPELNTRVALQAFVSIVRDTEYDDLIRNQVVPAEELVETLTIMLIQGILPGMLLGIRTERKER
jgi:TetR/AcrR family transcriptional regulator, fatty acid metabolism regulator protein